MSVLKPKLRIKIEKSKLDNFPNNSTIEINLVSKLGAGNYGKVYKINDTLSIKILKNKDCDEYDLSSELINIPHSEYCKNLVEPFAIGKVVQFKNTDNDELYNNWLDKNKLTDQKIILLPLLQKVDLHQFDLKKIIYSVCNAEYFLEKNFSLLHLDIKPNNLMTDGSRIILIDLGFVKKSDEVFYPKKNYNFLIWPTIICKNSYVPCYSIALLIINLFIPIYREESLNSDKLLFYINRCNLSQYYKQILMKMIIPSIDYKNLTHLF